jgi:hypothetical protein
MNLIPRYPCVFVSLLLAASFASSQAALLHRFSFKDDGSDSVGKLQANLKGPSAKIAEGQLRLSNDSAASGDKISHVEFSGSVLPQGGLSTSLVVWFTAKDAGDFARVLNIGASEGGEGMNFIYFSPRTADGTARVAITGNDVSSKSYLDFSPLDDGKPHMVAIVIDGAAKKLRVFVDGKEQEAGENLGDNTLDKVKTSESWIGRSSFSADPGLTGTIDEFRVYDHALTSDEVVAAQKAGPDALP